MMKVLDSFLIKMIAFFDKNDCAASLKARLLHHFYQNLVSRMRYNNRKRFLRFLIIMITPPA